MGPVGTDEKVICPSLLVLRNARSCFNASLCDLVRQGGMCQMFELVLNGFSSLSSLSRDEVREPWKTCKENEY